MTLRGRVSRGLFWESVATLGGRAISLLVTLLLARLLAPADFGLVSIATLAINSLIFLQELGFGAALIQRRKDVEAAAITAHWTIIASSVVLYVVAFLTAPLVAWFFRSPDVTAVLRVLSLTIVLGSLGRVPYTLLSREMDFRRKVLPDLLSNFTGNLVSLALVVVGWGVWGLVFGQLTTEALRSALAYRVSSWRPRWRFDRRLFRELFGYGKHVATSQVLIFGITNVDDMFVGRMLGEAALGQYSMAYNLSNMPATNITRLVTRVTFPAFSELQDDMARMRRAYFSLVRYVSILSVPIAVATMIFADDFVHAVLGAKWAPAIVPLQILAVYGLLRSVAANMGTVFQAGGKPQWLSSIAAWRLITMTALLYPAITWNGIVGVCWLSTGVAVVDFFISAWLVNRIVDGRMATYGRILLPLLLTAAAAGVLGYAITHWLFSLGVWDVLALAVGGGVLAATYGAAVYWRNPDLRDQARALVNFVRQRAQWKTT